MFCRGNASDTAVNASSLNLATKTLSTTLYSAFIIMDSIIGTAMENNNFGMGIVPILSALAAAVSFAIQLPPSLLNSLTKN